MRQCLLVLIFGLFHLSLRAQGIRFVIAPQPAEIRVDQLRFYIGNIELLDSGRSVWKENSSYHLIDLERKSADIRLSAPVDIQFTHFRFTLGVDSITNTRGAQAGVLDAMHGMYWAWHSGFINLKLEGILTNSRKEHAFRFHLGGFRKGENCEQTVTLESYGFPLVVRVDPARLLEDLEPGKETVAMTPGANLVKLSFLAVKMFSTSR